eukprot:TRINITY_DN1055_c0_g1_i1.p1 TRINITY_DN1055_c0_g1~~TRINITY_DN1055_c0_g1_i1.p1  ORF type:complete len:143 (-),score=20.64 TRINITY_DN1055_c0_g1_i1:563-991(-)
MPPLIVSAQSRSSGDGADSMSGDSDERTALVSSHENSSGVENGNDVQRPADAAAGPKVPQRHKTKFPAAPGKSRTKDVSTAEVAARAQKTWAKPGLRTQVAQSYGSLPDLQVIPENVEVQTFQSSSGQASFCALGCPTCVIS